MVENKKKISKKKKVATVAKSVKKQIDSNKKATNKALKHNTVQDKEIEKLKSDLSKLKSKDKNKKNTKRVSEYNLFIRKQIKSGLTFERAVKEWNKFRLLESKQKRKPSAYNQFIGSQMKLGKTFEESVKLWKLAKSGQLGKKGSTKTITKTVVKTRTVKSKPTVIVKKVKSKPKVVEKIRYRTRKINVPVENKTKKVIQKSFDYDKLKEIFLLATPKVETITTSEIKKSFEADDEEIAFKIVQTYFKEIARFGFKKQLTLDEIIDAYIYSLARVKRNEARELEIAERVRKSGMRK